MPQPVSAPAISSARTYFGYREATEDEKKYTKVASTQESTYTWLADIKDTPDFGGEPETIETTTLSNKTTTSFILGLQSLSGYSFTVNFRRDRYIEIEGMKGKDYVFCVVLQDGTLIEWMGQLSQWMNGTSTNSVVEATVYTSSATEPVVNETYIATFNEDGKTITLSQAAGE